MRIVVAHLDQYEERKTEGCSYDMYTLIHLICKQNGIFFVLDADLDIHLQIVRQTKVV